MINNNNKTMITTKEEHGRGMLPSMTSPMAQLGRAIAVASSSSSSSSSTSFLFNPLNELRQAARSGFNSARKNISENKDAKKANAVFCASMSAAQYNSKHNNRRSNNKNTMNEIMVPIRGTNKFLGAMIPGDSAVEVVLTSGLFSTLNIYNTLLIGRLIVTWFPAAPQQIVYPLATICDPYLNLFRGIIPPLGGIDLSPILAFTALNFFTSTAAALPAQIDGDGNIVGVPEKKNVFKGLFAEKKEKR
jgi:YggT family protein